MSGHSKWATIKHKKAVIDAKRGKAFTRITKEINVAARTGGGDLASNPRLRHLVEKARALNMPSDNITRAIKRGTGELPGVNYEPFTYEGYGPYNVAVMVETLSDNKNRTVAELRRLFSSNDGSLAENGAVSWMFNKLGVVRISAPTILSEDTLLEQLIDFDITEIECTDTTATIMCNQKSLEQVKEALTKLNYNIENAELEWVASTTVDLDDEKEAKAIAFLEELEDHDDVQHVYANLA